MKKRLKATTIDENFRTFIASKRSSGVREKTILSYHQAYQAINKHYPIGEMDMTAFHADTLNALIEALLRANLSRNSIHTYTVALASFFNWCKTEGISRYTFKPYKGEETVKTPYTDVELKLLLKKPNLKRCDFSEYRTWVIINLLLNCGCRASTIRSFHIQDLDLENRVLFARHVKNNRPQPLPLCSDMVAILQEYLTYREGKAHEPLFPSDADQPMTENGLRCSIANYNRKRGVEKTSIHLFRHTFARKYLVDCGGNAFTLQKLLGHSTLDMTKHYCAIYDVDLIKDFDEFSPLSQLSTKRIKLPTGKR